MFDVLKPSPYYYFIFKSLDIFLSYLILDLIRKIETNLTLVDLNSNHVNSKGRTVLKILFLLKILI